MHSHAERGNDQIAGAVEIVPHAPRGNAARDAPRSASGGGGVTQSVTGCIPTQSVGTIRLRGLWRSFLTLRVGMPPGTLRVPLLGGGVTQSVTGCIPTQSVGTIRLRGLWRSFLTLRVGMPPGTLRVPLLEGDAERHGMHSHAERGNDRVAGGCGDRSSRSAWECRQGRSAFRFWRVTQSVTGCMPTRSVGTIRLRGLWRSFLTLRVGMPPGTLRVPLLEGDAERHGMHAHAERANDQIAGAVEIVPHAPRGNAARDAPRSASGG